MAEIVQVELRGPCPKPVVDVLDAVSMSKGITRTELVNRILGIWARRKLHEHSLVSSITRGNPAMPDQPWQATE